MIYINFVDLHSLMLHAKFQNHRPPGSEEEDFLRFLIFIAMVAILVGGTDMCLAGHLPKNGLSGHCDYDYLCKLSFTLPERDAPHKVWL